MKTQFVLFFFLLSFCAAFGQTKIYLTSIDATSILRCDPDGSNLETLVITGYYTEDIVIDTVRQKMYWTGHHYNSGNTTGVLGCADLDGKNVRSVKRPGEYPRKIAIDYARNCLYWSDGRRGSIRKSNFEFTDVHDIVRNIKGPIGLDLDPHNQKIYWSCFQDDIVESANLDGTDRKLVFKPGENAGGIKLDLRHSKIYWTNNVQGRIFRANLDGTKVDTLVTDLFNVTVLDLDVQAQKIYWTENNLRNTSAKSRIGCLDPDGRNVKILGIADTATTFFGIKVVKLPAPNAKPAGPAAKTDTKAAVFPLQFDHREYDFGLVEAGKRVRHTFRFKNIGASEIVISGISDSQDELIGFWPETPIPPGGGGEIAIEYCAEGRLSEFFPVHVYVQGLRESAELTLRGDARKFPPVKPVFEGYSAYKPGDTLHVLAQSGLVLREMPQPDGKKIRTLPFASPLTVLAGELRQFPHRAEAFEGFEVSGHWVKVRTAQGLEGYVFDGFLSRYKAPAPLKVKEWLRGQFVVQEQLFQKDHPKLLDRQVFRDGTTCQYFNMDPGGRAYDFEIRFGASMTLAEGWLLARAFMFGKEKNHASRRGHKIWLNPDAAEGRAINVNLRNGKIALQSSYHAQEGCGH